MGLQEAFQTVSEEVGVEGGPKAHPAVQLACLQLLQLLGPELGTLLNLLLLHSKPAQNSRTECANVVWSNCIQESAH